MFSMGYQLFAPGDHEWSGAILLVLFICHHLLNRRWWACLVRGRYTAWRAAVTAVDAAMLVFIALLMWSGIAMSQYVFTFLPSAGGMSLMRRLHLIASGWTFVLAAFHLGLHWHIVLKQRQGSGRLLFWIGAAVAAYGLCVFVSRNFVCGMFLLNEYADLNFDENPLLFYLDYSAVFGTFIFGGWAVRRLLTGRKQETR